MGQSQTTLETTQDGGAAYHYHPLTGKEFRLIHLHTNKDGKLYCTIEHAILGQSVEYIALSYAWGDGDTPFRINVKNERKVSIGFVRLTTNLHTALIDLWRAPGVSSKTFWIDQIAINQDDLRERGSQVALMAEIYQRASQVITYLGPRMKGDAAAIDLMERVEAHFQKQFESKLRGSDLHRKMLEEHDAVSQEPANSNNYRYLLLSGSLGQNMLRDLKVPEISANDPGWQIALELTTPSCCQRLWMMQENILNNETFMLRGTTLIEWKRVAAFASLVNAHPIFIPPARLASPEFQAVMHQLWCLKTLKNPLSLLELMWIAQPYSCSDPRDRVYACLGIARDRIELGIVPDYTQPVEEVYTDVARRTLLHQQNLDSLDFVMEPDYSLTCPSWAQQSWGKFRETGTRRFHFSLSDDWRASGERPGRVRFEGNILIVDGGVVDTVSSLQTTLHFRERDYYDDLFHRADAQCKMLLQGGAYGETDLRDRYNQLVDSEVSQAQQRQSQLDEMMSWATQRGIDDDIAATELYCTLAMIQDYPQEYPPQKGMLTLKRVISSDETQLRELSRIVKMHPYLFHEKKERFKISSLSDDDGDTLLARVLFSHPIATVERTIFFTESGRFGSVTAKVQKGDDIAVLNGGRAVYVLRPGENDYRFVGGAYLYGFMGGQACLESTFEDNIQPIRIR